ALPARALFLESAQPAGYEERHRVFRSGDPSRRPLRPGLRRNGRLLPDAERLSTAAARVRAEGANADHARARIRRPTCRSARLIRVPLLLVRLGLCEGRDGIPKRLAHTPPPTTKRISGRLFLRPPRPLWTGRRRIGPTPGASSPLHFLSPQTPPRSPPAPAVSTTPSRNARRRLKWIRSSPRR